MASVEYLQQAKQPAVRHRRVSAWLQATPLTVTFALFFIVPLVITLIVSFWDFNEYQIIPAFTLKNYAAIFDGCTSFTDVCVTFKTYWSTLKFCAMAGARRTISLCSSPSTAAASGSITTSRPRRPEPLRATLRDPISTTAENPKFIKGQLPVAPFAFLRRFSPVVSALAPQSP